MGSLNCNQSKAHFCLWLAHTVLEGVSDDDVGFVGLLEDSALRGTEEHHERLRSFNGRVLDVVHDGQATGLWKRRALGRFLQASPVTSEALVAGKVT